MSQIQRSQDEKLLIYAKAYNTLRTLEQVQGLNREFYDMIRNSGKIDTNVIINNESQKRSSRSD